MELYGAANKPGFLYIIHEDGGDYYKVGVSETEDSLRARLQNLQSGNWRKLTKLQASKVSNMNKAEQYAHDKLRALQVRAGGGTEWFKGPLATIKNAVDEAVKKYPSK